MTDRRNALYLKPQMSATVIVDNDNASKDLVTEPAPLNTGGNHLYMERLMVSVYEPSQGNGILELRDSSGNVKWRTNTDGVKDLNLNFGEQGLYIGQNTGLKAVVSSSSSEQASVSVIFMGHFAKNRVTDPVLTASEQAL